VGGCLGDIGWAVDSEFLAQHWDHVLAEQSSCSSTVFSGRPAWSTQEQLALVVAEVLAERQRLVDHLLRAADGQRCLAVKSSRDGPWP
jgi:hypothetical protein